MTDFFKIVAEIVNVFHDLIMGFAASLGWQATDKDLHLWIIGIISIISFFIVQAVFKRLAKWSITSISFIYTFTMVLVLVFAIEIQQGITGRGNMEFADAVYGIYGFFLFFGFYLIFRLLTFGIKKLYANHQKNKQQEEAAATSSTEDRNTRYKG